MKHRTIGIAFGLCLWTAGITAQTLERMPETTVQGEAQNETWGAMTEVPAGQAKSGRGWMECWQHGRMIVSEGVLMEEGVGEQSGAVSVSFSGDVMKVMSLGTALCLVRRS